MRPSPAARPSPALLLAGMLLLASAPSALAEGGASAPGDGAVTVLGTGPLRKARVVVRGVLEKVAALEFGVEVATIKVEETLWGESPGKDRIRILSNETGYFARVSPEAIYFVEPMEGGGRFTCHAVVDGVGAEGAARVAAVRRSLDIERRPAAERPAALRAACFESLGAPDSWTRQNAGRELAHLAEILPRAFSAEDLKDLRRAAQRERDSDLRRFLVATAQVLARAAEEGGLAPGDGKTVTLRGAPLLRRLREDPDPKARRAAAEAAAGEGEAGNEALAEALEKDADAGVRTAAAEALGSGGSAAAGPVLLRRAKEDPDPGVRGAAVEALGILGVGSAVPRLLEIARSDPPVSRGALFALARIRTADAVEALKGVRVEAADSKDAGAREARELIDFLLSEDFLRQEEALKKIRDSAGK